MGRCFGCHQDSCGYRKNCPCVCHRDDITVVTQNAPPAAQPNVEEQTYTFYAVASRDDLTKAQWYRTYSANGSSGWVKDLADAKVWVKRSSAKSKCTNLGPSARLVEFTVTKVNVVDNSDSFKKAAEKRRLEEERRQKREAEAALERAQADFDRAQKRLDALKGK